MISCKVVKNYNFLIKVSETVSSVSHSQYEEQSQTGLSQDDIDDGDREGDDDFGVHVLDVDSDVDVDLDYVNVDNIDDDDIPVSFPNALILNEVIFYSL